MIVSFSITQRISSADIQAWPSVLPSWKNRCTFMLLQQNFEGQEVRKLQRKHNQQLQLFFNFLITFSELPATYVFPSLIFAHFTNYNAQARHCVIYWIKITHVLWKKSECFHKISHPLKVSFQLRDRLKVIKFKTKKICMYRIPNTSPWAFQFCAVPCPLLNMVISQKWRTHFATEARIY